MPIESPHLLQALHPPIRPLYHTFDGLFDVVYVYSHYLNLIHMYADKTTNTQVSIRHEHIHNARVQKPTFREDFLLSPLCFRDLLTSSLSSLSELASSLLLPRLLFRCFLSFSLSRSRSFSLRLSSFWT